MGIIMLIGQIILMQMWNANWFKRENFKIQKSNVLAENRIKLKKLEKDLGVTAGKNPPIEKSTGENIMDWVNILKNIDHEKLKGLADTFLAPEGEDYEEEEDEDIVGTILKNIPEKTIQGFVNQYFKGQKQQMQTPKTSNY